MRQRLRSHLTYANVMVTILAFLVLGGGSAYATHLVVNSSDVVDNSLQSVDLKDNAGVTSADVVDDTATGGGLVSADIRNGEVRTGEVRDGAVRGADVLNDSLTGADVQESSLGKVPSASSADSVNGKTASQLEGARAYAYMGGSCTPFCVLPRNKGVAYIVSIGSGRYCVGTNGINAADPQSVALASAATTSAIGHHDAEWKISNQGCVPAEFEIKTEIAGLASNAVPFTIVIP